VEEVTGHGATHNSPVCLWSVVTPLKPLTAAKSRLAGPAGPLRPELALAFARDTVSAVLACPLVRDVTVVTDDPLAGAELAALGALVLADTPAAGLNAALRHAAGTVRRRSRGVQDGADVPVAALNADLPALRPAELAAVLAAAARLPGRAFLADAAGVGTTLLAATSGVPLWPAFGGPSRTRHRASGAREITIPGVDSVRQDVDTAEDLRSALGLGVGPHTEAVCLLLTGSAREYPHGPRIG
jgi:2-phospho-L-lactate/phosphoenolpyruvate guanylyltransferase